MPGNLLPSLLVLLSCQVRRKGSSGRSWGGGGGMLEVHFC